MPSFICLSEWMLHPSSHLVMAGQEAELQADAFVAKVTGWQQSLAEHSGQRWMVYHTDPAEFLAILFALWYLERIACIPSDNCPATLARLAEQTEGCAGELANAVKPRLEGESAPSPSKTWRKLAADIVAVELYTSGSSGEPKAIAKTLGQLENEVDCLERQWPTQAGAFVFSTVSHHHLYGLTFRLLRPFCAGQIIYREVCQYTEDIYNRALNCSQFVLVSSPSHISRLNTVLDWSRLSDACLNIFSAAAPLAKKDAERLSQLLDAPLWEIYGSSETGVIAWRRQSPIADSELWQLLPGVELHTHKDSLVAVNSPFVSSGQATLLDDHIRLDTQARFELCGRADNIAKIEGKRVSLTALERLLISHEWVREARAIATSGKRSETAVVLTLSPLGEERLMLSGNRALSQVLRTFLATDFEAVVLPRRWRFIAAMPTNSQGKVTRDALQKIISEKVRPKWPAIVETLHRENSIEIHCRIPYDLIYFDGHFANVPILPGVVQVLWAQKLGRVHFDIQPKFHHLERVKLSKILQPGDDIVITLEFDHAKQRLTYRYKSDKGLHSSGRVHFE